MAAARDAIACLPRVVGEMALRTFIGLSELNRHYNGNHIWSPTTTRAGHRPYPLEAILRVHFPVVPRSGQATG
jgi:hypothetical protein